MNENLEKVLRVLKHRELVELTSTSELARLSGLSRTTVNKSQGDIDKYLSIAPRPSASDEAYVDKKLITTYVDIALISKSDKSHFAQVMGAVAGYVLRTQSGLINNIQTPKKIVRAGQAYINLVTRVASRKGDKGTPISSQDKDAKYLLTELNNSQLVTTLFTRSDSYRADHYAKTWKLTLKAEQLNKLVVEETINLVADYNAQQAGFTLSPLHIGPPISSGKTVNLGLSPDSSVPPSYFELPISLLNQLSINSFIQVMGIAEPSTSANSITVPLDNLARVDPDKGRTYNIFTRLRSSERKALGYYNYDISGGLQVIAFGILFQYPHSKYEDFYDLRRAYPLIFEYATNPASKQALRQAIATDLGTTIEEVKKLLTAYANGSQKQAGNSEKLQKFFDESDQLRREVISVVYDNEPDLLQSAIEQSKKNFPEDKDWQSIEKEESHQEARDKASVFFFIWTFFEKQIRDVMLSLVDDGIPVHDAIYSKRVIPFQHFEDEIFKRTGFEVKISN
jgi:DNA-binding transcriptional MerR regulator